MADFMSNLWSSIFTPGATPTLLVATNATFAALQLLLGALLIATYSIHFAILSVLCGGLWWSVNWFATELKAAQAKEEEAEKLRKKKKGGSEGKTKGEVGDLADDEGEDTEVEGSRPGSRMKDSASSLSGGPPVDGGMAKQEPKPSTRAGSAAATGTEHGVGGTKTRQRRMEDAGEISTDSEWEKISQDGDR